MCIHYPSCLWVSIIQAVYVYPLSKLFMCIHYPSCLWVSIIQAVYVYPLSKLFKRFVRIRIEPESRLYCIDKYDVYYTPTQDTRTKSPDGR